MHVDLDFPHENDISPNPCVVSAFTRRRLPGKGTCATTKVLTNGDVGWGMDQCTDGKAVVFSRNRARSRDQTKAECPWGALGKNGDPIPGIQMLRRLPEADCPPLRTLTPLTNPAMQVHKCLFWWFENCLQTRCMFATSRDVIRSFAFPCASESFELPVSLVVSCS